jgi:glycosyltransferase involved in cell wall biosynthesis
MTPAEPRYHLLFAHPKLSFGGGERVMIEQIAAVADLPVNVSILFRKHPQHRDIEPEIRARNPHIREIVHAPGPLSCIRWLLRNRPDGIILCGNHGFRQALRILGWFGVRFRVMVTLHEQYPHQLGAYTGIRKLVHSWLVDYDFRAKVKETLGGERFHIVHPLYPRESSPTWNAESRRAARRALGLPEEGILIGYVGRQDPNKEPWWVIRYAELLEKALGQTVGVVLAGAEAPEVSRRLDETLRASVLNGQVWRLSRMEDNAPAFAALDLFLLTSYQEGFFPLSLIEAMERGVPVATTTVGGITSVLKEGEGAFLIHKADDRQSVSEAALEDCAHRVARLIRSPQAWEVQRQAAAALIRRVRDDYDAKARYATAILELLGMK